MKENFTYKVVGTDGLNKGTIINVIDGEKREIGDTIMLFGAPWKIVEKIQLTRQKDC